ncbi:MFS transporter, DHA1 family, bicyclomycin/chloramphenicol resistance protein [Sphingomonas guangdongensis]|uniref:MFS transporter, DHA1 family, bicyclomycin/chloramphenicol resistance protein n=1 Tax=Sphingomonas guangdongensis TaxID=1141890 RepID=A0A285QHD0_9SPHN|nr:MFS transporter, DHA1 family, bicyclomycin/chloramphenicol resistance protein [Sphingomonas guangdongensis]
MRAGIGRAQLLLLGGIAALGSLATQIIVPALPLVAQGLVISAADGQLIITVYLVGLALGQLVGAPLADRYGRRPVILGGLTVFAAGTLACGAAGSLAVMLAGRAVQSLGAATALVTARAMATDRAPKGSAAAPLALMSSVTLISPTVAPTIGGALTSIGGWQAPFWLLLALSIAAIALAPLLGETRPGDRLPIGPARLARTYFQVVRKGRYLPLALSNALITGGMYVYLAVSPFLLRAAGASPAQAGLYYSVVASAMIAGTLAVPRVMARWPGRLGSIGAAALGSGAVLVMAVAATGGNLVALLAAMMLIAFGSGMTGPALMAQALERQRDNASAAISLFGMTQMGGAALFSTATVRLVPSPSLKLALIGVLVLLALALRRYASRGS